MARPTCTKCGGRLVYDSYPAENMLVRKCWVCGKIDRYHELTREEAQRLFRRVDRPVRQTRLAS